MDTKIKFKFDSVHRYLYADFSRLRSHCCTKLVFEGTSPCPFPTCTAPFISCKLCIRSRETRLNAIKSLLNDSYVSRFNRAKDLNLPL